MSVYQTFYTLKERRKGSRRAYRCGLRSNSLQEIRELALADKESGKFTMIKIVDADDDTTIEMILGRKQ